MSDDYAAVREASLAALQSGDVHPAFHGFRVVLDYPAQVADDEQWLDALGVFARIGAAIAGDDFRRLVQQVIDAPGSVQALYNLGYQLIEDGLPEIAATVLARANALTPQQEPIVTELVAALEQ